MAKRRASKLAEAMNLPATVENESPLKVKDIFVLPGATRNGVTLPEDTSLDTWKRYVANLMDIQRGSMWCIGDLLNFAEARGKEWANEAVQYVTVTLGFADTTAYKCTYVARRFAKERRREEPWMTFSHHEAVAFMKSKKVADDLLEQAAQGKWTVSQLKAAVREKEAKQANRKGNLKAVPTKAEEEPQEQPAQEAQYAPEAPPPTTPYPEQPAAAQTTEEQAEETEDREADAVAEAGEPFPVTDEDFAAAMNPLCARAVDTLNETIKALQNPTRDGVARIQESAASGRDILIEVMDQCENFGAEPM